MNLIHTLWLSLNTSTFVFIYFMNSAVPYMYAQHTYTVNNYNLSDTDRKTPWSTNNCPNCHSKLKRPVFRRDYFSLGWLPNEHLYLPKGIIGIPRKNLWELLVWLFTCQKGNQMPFLSPNQQSQITEGWLVGVEWHFQAQIGYTVPWVYEIYCICPGTNTIKTIN